MAVGRAGTGYHGLPTLGPEEVMRAAGTVDIIEANLIVIAQK